MHTLSNITMYYNTQQNKQQNKPNGEKQHITIEHSAEEYTHTEKSTQLETLPPKKSYYFQT